MKAEPGAGMQRFYYEETTWKARPTLSPDGAKLVYSSYLGRQWQQLWAMPPKGGDVFPLTYGEFDRMQMKNERSEDGQDAFAIGVGDSDPEDGLPDLRVDDAVGECFDVSHVFSSRAAGRAPRSAS